MVFTQIENIATSRCIIIFAADPIVHLIMHEEKNDCVSTEKNLVIDGTTQIAQYTFYC